MLSKHKSLFVIAALAILLMAVQIPMTIAQESSPSCGTDPVTLNAYFETGFDLPFKLSDEFAKQFPNVTWDIK